jgi:peptidoglycan DL-endopeptidase CwlO
LLDRTRAVLLLVLVLFAALGANAGTAFAGQDVPATVTTEQAVEQEQQSIVRYAQRFVGVPYSYGGASPSGFDCSGFTRYVYAHFGIDLPHYSGGQYGLGHPVSKTALKPGDLVFFDGLGHVGIYVGGGRFIHAPHTGTSVSVESMAGWYGARYVGARRLV